MTEDRAVATTAQQVAVEPARHIISTPTGDLERIARTVSIPAIYQYSMWRPGNQPPKVSLTSEAYAYLNRELGVTFIKAPKVPDSDGNMVANPIHRPGYIYLRTTGVWRNRNGLLVAHTEDVEVDYNLVYQDARINAKSATVVLAEDGTPKTIDNRPVYEGGMPMVKLSPEDELKALKTLSQLRTFGLRYVQTIAQTRILKRATGISSLPIPQPANFSVEIVTFRDNLTPEERVRQSGVDLDAMYGKGEVLSKDDVLNSDEMAEVHGGFDAEDMTEDIEAEAVSERIARQEDRSENDGPNFDAPIRRVGPEDVDPDGLFDAPAPKRQRRPQ